ncbi:hypothetical protein RFI_25338 [Reticulomyxa filosa]|uniref:Uncharacterized protein n=1 Tax=Reticulomyxa filosa TaxID=46433 RepID=X6MF45_RETFI|nr:hypothetical protein RFI_25338 [Reticulomyxa filosa]|eukprot:ETO12037.1 hypothetical protein RFI_25338 [Reticulomyxa filosa]
MNVDDENVDMNVNDESTEKSNEATMPEPMIKNLAAAELYQRNAKEFDATSQMLLRGNATMFGLRWPNLLDNNPFFWKCAHGNSTHADGNAQSDDGHHLDCYSHKHFYVYVPTCKTCSGSTCTVEGNDKDNPTDNRTSDDDTTRKYSNDTTITHKGSNKENEKILSWTVWCQSSIDWSSDDDNLFNAFRRPSKKKRRFDSTTAHFIHLSLEPVKPLLLTHPYTANTTNATDTLTAVSSSSSSMVASSTSTPTLTSTSTSRNPSNLCRSSNDRYTCPNVNHNDSTSLEPTDSSLWWNTIPPSTSSSTSTCNNNGCCSWNALLNDNQSYHTTDDSIPEVDINEL